MAPACCGKCRGVSNGSSTSEEALFRREVMKTCVLIRNFTWTIAALFGCVGLAQAQIAVTEAQIGCTDLTQNRGNLTAIVGSACNGKFSCSFPYTAGPSAHKRWK